MSTATLTPELRSGTIPEYRLSFLRALRSEAIKLATLRSTWWSIGIVALITIGLAIVIGANIPVEFQGFTAMVVIASPIQFTMMLAGILGAIAVTGEYSTGMIRSTLTADPIRGSVLAAKSIAAAATMFLSSLVIFLLAAIAVSPILGERGVEVPWSDVEAFWLPLLGASFSMAVFALIGVSFGFVLRSGAGAISATVGVLFVLPLALDIVSASGGPEWISDLAAYLPSSASTSLIIPNPNLGLDAPAAFAALCGWAVIGMLASWAVLRGRDA